MGAIWSAFLHVLKLAFVFFTGVAGGNYVLGILLFTIVVRLVLFPLGVTQVRSFQKMAKLGPRQRELQAKHKGNPQKLQQELAALYKEEGVNPAAGCLPLLLQLPVMYGLFEVLEQFSYKVGHGVWVWQQLNKPDPTALLALLVAVSTYFMQRQSMAMTPPQPGMEQSQKLMTWMMPVVFGYVAWRLAAGLSIYYVASNLFQVGQTAVLLKRPIENAAPKPRPKAST
jgi:YidC/Oxa1 family membrane protein insertase